MMIDRHAARPGDRLWAFVDGVPTHVRFDGLLPYNGFRVREREDEPPTEVSDPALFADTREELVAAQVARWQAEIFDLERRIALLHATEPEPSGKLDACAARVIEAAMRLRDSGYDGPFVGEPVRPLFEALAACERTGAKPAG